MRLTVIVLLIPIRIRCDQDSFIGPTFLDGQDFHHLAVLNEQMVVPSYSTLVVIVPLANLLDDTFFKSQSVSSCVVVP